MYILLISGGFLNLKFLIDIYLEKKYDSSCADNGEKQTLDNQLTKKMRDFNGHIIRDFILSWYNTVSSDVTFVQQAFEVFDHIFNEGRKRISTVDHEKAVNLVLEVIIGHLNAFKNSELQRLTNKENSTMKEYLKLFRHPAINNSPTSELEHLRSIVLLLLKSLLPKEYYLHGTSTYLVRELISQNVLYAVVNLMSKPEWVYQAIIQILEDEIPISTKNLNQDCSENNYLSDNEQALLSLSNPTVNSDSLPLASVVEDETEDELYNQVDGETDESIKQDSVVFGSRPSVIGQEDDVDPEEINTTRNRSSVTDVPLPFNSFLDHFSNDVSKSNEKNKQYIPFRFRPQDHLFHHIRIKDTLIMSEALDKNSKYTLYRITYCVAATENDQNEVSEKPFNVCRRFREFMALQERLQQDPIASRLTKHVRGPSRMFPVPFGNMDKVYIEQRRKYLQAYLRELSSISYVNASKELKEFLAYNGDPRIAFVQKPSTLPRFDKILKSAISDLFGSSTKLDEDSCLENSNFSGGDVKENYTQTGPVAKIKSMVMRNSVKMLPEEEWKLGMNFSTFQGPRHTEICPSKWICPDSLEDEIIHNSIPKEPSQNQTLRTSGDGCELAIHGFNADSNKQTLQISKSGKTILKLAQNIWDMSNGVYSVLCISCGEIIQRYIDYQVRRLTTGEKWCEYIEALKSSLWPEHVQENFDGDLQTLRSKAEEILYHTFPFPLRVIVGEEKYRLGIHFILDSLEDPTVTRNIVYHFLDVILKLVFGDFDIITSKCNAVDVL